MVVGTARFLQNPAYRPASHFSLFSIAVLLSARNIFASLPVALILLQNLMYYLQFGFYTTVF